MPEWQVHPVYVDYEVSTHGDVRRATPGKGTWPGRMIRSQQRGENRFYVPLMYGRREIKADIHTLVLETFVGPRPEGYHGCHTNGDSSDNRLDNLRWDTPTANENDKRIHGTFRGKLTLELARKIRKSHLTNTQLAKIYGVNQSQISRIRSGERYREAFHS